MSDKIIKPAPQLPVHYKPDVGLKTVAVAEAAERHFRRAKDATRLLEAVELKLGEQRKFVLWWKANGGAGRPKLLATTHNFLKDLGVDAPTLYRWRTRLLADRDFQSTLTKAQASCIKVCEARSGQNDYAKATSTGEFEWYTPAEYIEAAREVLGAIDLDPATSEQAQRLIKASRYFTRADDGLGHAWPGRVWLNPPYTQPDIALFITKLVEQYTLRQTTAALLLTHNYTDTAWFQLAASVCQAICFTRGRIAFVDAQGTEASPTQGQAFFYFGQDVARFQQRFTEVGFLVRPL